MRSPAPPRSVRRSASGQTVFLSDGRKKDYEDKEWWYEEFCYKKFKGRERNKEGAPSPLSLSPPFPPRTSSH